MTRRTRWIGGSLLVLVVAVGAYFWLTSNSLPPPSVSPSAAELDFREFVKRFRDCLMSDGKESVKVLEINVKPIPEPPMANFLMRVVRDSGGGGSFPPTHWEAHYYGEFTRNGSGIWQLVRAQSASIREGTVGPMEDMPNDNIMQQITHQAAR